MLAILVVCASTAVSRQIPERTPYGDLVDAYRRREAAPLQRVLQFTHGEISDEVEHALSDDTATRWPASELCAAGMLHTDAALRLSKDKRASDAQFHLDAAIALLDAARRRSDEQVEFVRRWRIVVGGLLRANDLAAAADRLESSTTEWRLQSAARTKARLRFERGLTSEIQGATSGSLSGRWVGYRGAFPPVAASSFAAAAAEYEAALAYDPQFVEAALHLGRVRMLQSRYVDAVQWLNVAEGGMPRVQISYLADLFLGAIAERQDQYDEAQRHYAAALTEYRWGQSAHLALAQLLSRTGREDEARAELLEHLSRSDGQWPEPLWTYLAEPDEQLGLSLAELRAEVWR